MPGGVAGARLTAAPYADQVDQVIYLCEYLPDGYTSNFKKNLRSNPCGFGLFYRDQVIRDTRLFGKVKACVRSLQCILYCWLKK